MTAEARRPLADCIAPWVVYGRPLAELFGALTTLSRAGELVETLCRCPPLPDSPRPSACPVTFVPPRRLTPASSLPGARLHRTPARGTRHFVLLCRGADVVEDAVRAVGFAGLAGSASV